MTNLYRALAELVRRQHGVITYDQAISLGLTTQQVFLRVQRGEWIRVHRGVYRIAAAPVSWHQQAQIALFVCGPFAAVSHGSAARLWQLRGAPEAGLTLSAPIGSSRLAPGAHVRFSTWLPEHHVVTLEGLRVTSPVRTLLDFASTVRYTTLESAVHDARHRELVTIDDLYCILDEMGGRGRRGTASLRKAVAKLDDGNAPAESELEVRFLQAVIEAHDLPRPRRQVTVTAGPRVARLDFAYPDRMVAIELDGERWHGSPADQARDRARDRTLTELGWVVQRFTWEAVTTRPDWVARRVQALLARSLVG
jgi:very-short-patch-repair endonuclease